MPATVLALWTKLRRPTLVGGTYGAIALVSVLVTALVFLTAGESFAAAPGAPGPGATSLEALAEPSGLLAGLTASVTLLGVIALSVAAATFAGEYTTGTLRNLLIRQPRRARLLGGMWGAVAAFTLGAVVVATIVSAGTAVALAGGQGVDTAAWFTADGLAESLSSVALVGAAVVGFATFGAVLGVLLRGPVLAVALGIAWLLPVETILVGTLDGAARWLPGQLLSAVAMNGTADVTAAAAAATVGAYLLAAAAGTTAVFVRRDVTA